MEEAGLTPARAAGSEAARGGLLVFVDDDNVLAPDYLEACQTLNGRYPGIGVFSASIEAEPEAAPSVEMEPYWLYLAVRPLERDYWANLPAPHVWPIGAGMEEVEIPPGVPLNAVLVIVRGDSMHPRYFDGEYLFYVRDSRNPKEYLGRECVVKLADGRVFVKVLRRGSDDGFFNLESWNSQTLEDQIVEWAAPVVARVNRQRR